ncbi:MAG TPA: succinyldiaminopimelate transaminase [Actinomycetaceae bacterium]|nr:succinyldiaminopimelate transaminase [Actinomycetaceae bacterium]
MGFRGSDLPDFPWDSLAGAKARAAAHPGGIVDLSIGTPVDPTPAIARRALDAASDSPGYPTVIGTPELRAAMVAWFGRRRGARLTEAEILPTIGSKEMVAHLPSLLGLGEGDLVVHPAVAYPTYDVGARLAGATPFASDDVAAWPGETRLVWLNSPGNPHGHVLGLERLREIVAWARERNAVVAADECYAELAWQEPWASEGVPSLLDERVCEGDHRGLLVAHSMSKQSNLAGYRAAMLAGDADLIGAIREIRKHSGMMMPGPVQAAMTAVLGDDGHVEEQVERYRRRREILSAAVVGAGLELDPDSAAGLYLWGRAATSSSELVGRFAELGILVAPGTFYGPAAEGYVRIALSATDERIGAAVARLTERESALL